MAQSNIEIILLRHEGLVSWEDQLKTSGPGIHNISLVMNDLESVREALLEKGCKEQMKMMVERRDGQGSGQLSAYIIDAFEQAGMRFELVPSEGGYKSDTGYEALL